MTKHNGEEKPATAWPGGENARSEAAGSSGAWNGSGRGAQPAAPNITPAFVWHAVRRWWKVCLPVGVVLAAVGGALVWFQFRPEYRAEAWVQIQDRAPYVAYAPQRNNDRFVRTQVEIMRSPPVLGRVVSEPTIARLSEVQAQPSPTEWLRGRLTVRSVGRSELFQISFTGHDAESTAEIVNAVLDAYLKLHSEVAGSRTRRIIELLEQERERRASNVKRLRENLGELARHAGGDAPVFLDNQGVLIVRDQPENSLQGLQQRLALTEVERQVVQARLQANEESLDTEPPEVPAEVIDAAVQSDPQVREQRSLIRTARARLSQLENISVRGDEDPEIIRLRADIQGYEEQLEQLQQERRPELAESLQGQLLRRRAQSADRLRDQIEVYELLENFLKQRIEQQTQELQQRNSRWFDLELARTELAREQEVFYRITDRVEQMRTELRAPPQISTFQRATVPPIPVQTPTKKVVLASAGVFWLPFVLAVLWERRIRRIGEPQQIQQEANLPVLGEITHLPLRSLHPWDRKSRRFDRDLFTFEESVDYVRTTLTLCDDLRHAQVIAVASAVSREGKTSLASHLAVSLARCQSAEPILLIDADLRHPDVHELFDIPAEPGLAEVLRSRCSFDEAVVSDWGGNLHLLCAGAEHRNPDLLLGDGRFHSVLQRARSGYRYIVIDAPPVLPVGDGLIIAKAADGTLLSTLRDVSRGPQVRMACERLAAAGARLLGAVLNGVPARHYAYRYGSDGYQYAGRREVDEPSEGNGEG